MKCLSLFQVYFVNYLLDECDADIEQRGVYEVQEDRSRHQASLAAFIAPFTFLVPFPLADPGFGAVGGRGRLPKFTKIANSQYSQPVFLPLFFSLPLAFFFSQPVSRLRSIFEYIWSHNSIQKLVTQMTLLENGDGRMDINFKIIII